VGRTRWSCTLNISCVLRPFVWLGIAISSFTFHLRPLYWNSLSRNLYFRFLGAFATLQSAIEMASCMCPLGLSVCLEIWNTPRTTDRIYMILYVVSWSFTKLCQQMSIIVKKRAKTDALCVYPLLVCRTARSDGRCRIGCIRIMLLLLVTEANHPPKCVW
jgi:amino acid permease